MKTSYRKLCGAGCAILLACASITARATIVTTLDGESIRIADAQAAVVQQGVAALRAGDNAAAARHFSAALTHKPDRKSAAVIYDLRAQARLQRDELNLAMQDANAAIGLYPQLSSPYSKKGVIFRVRGDYRRALAEYDKAVARNSKLAQTYYNRAITKGYLGRQREAIEDYNRAIELNPNYADAYHNRGVDYYYLGEFEKAAADFGQALRRDPKMINAYLNRANAYKKMGRLQDARSDYMRAARGQPRNASEFLKRAIARVALGNYAGAAADKKAALARAPRSLEAISSMAWFEATCPAAQFRNGRDAVKKATFACQQTHWRDADFLATLAAAYAETGDFDRAIQLGKQAIAREPVTSERKKVEEDLALYRRGKPVRDTPDVPLR